MNTVNTTSAFLAAFWGIFLMLWVVAIALIPSIKERIIPFFYNDKRRYAAAFLSLCIGLGSVYMHNIWTADMHGLITFFGWSALLKSILVAFVPSSLKISESIIKSNWFSFYLLLLFCTGLYMLQWSLQLTLNA